MIGKRLKMSPRIISIFEKHTMTLSWPLKILKENQRNHLNNLCIAVSVITILFSGYIVDAICTSVDDRWQVMLDLYRASFLLVMFTFSGFWKKIAVAVLVNHFIDRHIGCDSWSMNDTITVIYVSILTIKDKL